MGNIVFCFTPLRLVRKQRCETEHYIAHANLAKVVRLNINKDTAEFNIVSIIETHHATKTLSGFSLLPIGFRPPCFAIVVCIKTKFNVGFNCVRLFRFWEGGTIHKKAKYISMD